jgi:hypothetical protein
LRFTVPDVRPGRYTTITQCLPCAAFSGGAEMAPTGPVPGSFILTRRSDDGFPLLPVLLGAAAALVGVGASAGGAESDDRTGRSNASADIPEHWPKGRLNACQTQHRPHGTARLWALSPAATESLIE